MITNNMTVFVFTTLEASEGRWISASILIYLLYPFLKPIMKQATSGLALASGEVINSNDQFEVFNDARAVGESLCSRDAIR